jgi:multicomponent Na+:H+ antiporter subunit E
MVFLLSCLFRLLLWTLLTSDLSAVNLAIGVGLALLLPHARGPREPLAPTLRALMRSLIAVPLAYGEAFALIGSGDREEESWIERPAGDPRHRLLIFLEVLAITLTPFTIVLGLSNGERGPHYTIHQLRPRRGKPEEVQP